MKQDLNTRFLPEKTDRLTKAAKQFLSDYGVISLLGESLGGLLANAAPEERFDVLLSACGFEKDPSGFFRAVRQWIHDRSVKGEPASVKLNNIKLPNLFLYHLLEVDDPGQSLVNAKSSARLAQATGFPFRDPKSIGKVIDKYPVRLSSHVIRQSILSKAVAAQYLTFEDELDSNGHDMTFDGHFKQGLMEQMYRNRAIFLLDMRCPVYCRFCFRKHKSLRHEPSPSSEDVKKAVDRVRADKAVKEILITGGEPLLNRKNLDAALSGLRSVDHVKTLRIATRSLAYYPHLFLHHDRSLVSYLLDQQERCRKKGKRIEIGVHMVHPDEVSVQTLELISQLTSNGIPVYVQTPFLKELNDRGDVLGRLFSLLRQAGAEIYYIFTPCHPIHGTQKYWSPISLSMEAYAYLRAHTSDRAIPKLCTATPLG
ncbi:MAG: radical SAM protein, partial [Desulfobacterales bacterium]|nr:radical SAM protein [Desulfobacterales bacterium]